MLLTEPYLWCQLQFSCWNKLHKKKNWIINYLQAYTISICWAEHTNPKKNAHPKIFCALTALQREKKPQANNFKTWDSFFPFIAFPSGSRIRVFSFGDSRKGWRHDSNTFSTPPVNAGLKKNTSSTSQQSNDRQMGLVIDEYLALEENIAQVTSEQNKAQVCQDTPPHSQLQRSFVES